MDHPVLLTLAALTGALTGYGAATAYHRHRARRRALGERLLRARDARDHLALQQRLNAQRAERDVLTAATDTVDAAYARLTRSQEGGPTP
ncbi:hypothetical protein ACFWV1_26055 [Streptomyces sp. NPDC058700]|uniref:hypothetical protein n=1 Tax=Streptomyces sp. NPDC058700 TaxID=3346607 RepID=UPI003663C8BE